MKTIITICETCKSETANTSEASDKDGTRLAVLVEKAALSHTNVRVLRHSCLMGCNHGCNVAVQSEGKISYVLGRFEPDAHTADGIVKYAILHAQSPSGQVPFKQWPDAIKGHFIARIPVLHNEDSPPA